MVVGFKAPAKALLGKTSDVRSCVTVCREAAWLRVQPSVGPQRQQRVDGNAAAPLQLTGPA